MNRKNYNRYIEYLIKVSNNSRLSGSNFYDIKDELELVDIMETCDIEYQIINKNQRVMSIDEFNKKTIRERKLKQLLDV